MKRWKIAGAEARPLHIRLKRDNPRCVLTVMNFSAWHVRESIGYIEFGETFPDSNFVKGVPDSFQRMIIDDK